MKLTKNDLLKFAKGASLLTTGGGLCLAEQIESIDKHNDVNLELKDLNDFSMDDILITASEVGTADAKEMDKTNILPKMLATWEKMTGQKIAGVYAPELGQESIVIDTAIGLGVPLVDFDVAGGRAVPFVDINSFAAAGMDFSLTPMVVGTDQGDVIAVDSVMSITQTEKFLRPLTTLSSGGIAYFMGGMIRVGDLAGKDIQNHSISKAIKLGSSQHMSDLDAELQPFMKIKGKVTDKREVSQNGFNCYVATFITDDDKALEVYILNEALFIKDKNGTFLVEPPDKILLIDDKNLVGVSSKDFLDGQEVILLAVKADKLWAGEAGSKIFGSSRFVPDIFNG